MPSAVRAIRGATTIDEDTREHVHERVAELVRTVLERNDLTPDDLISIVFTATSDIHSVFPAEVARSEGLADVPLLCAQELEIDGATPRCIRLLVHCATERSRAEVRHVYLQGAVNLRADLLG